MTDFMHNGPDRTIVDVQEKPGATWQVLDPNASAGALSGGGRGVESSWGRDAHGSPLYLGTNITGNPNRVTMDVTQKVDMQVILGNLVANLNKKRKCCGLKHGLSVRVRERCGDINDLNGYEIAVTLIDGWSTGQSTSNPLANVEGASQEQMLVNNMSFGYATWQRHLTLQDVKGTVTDTALNDIVWRCADEYYAVSDADNTPGYLSQPTPLLWYTTDAGDNWSSIHIEPFLNGNASSVVIYGNRVLVASDTNGVAYCEIDRLKNGITNPDLWSLATSVTSVNRLTVAPGGTIWAVGDSGYIYKSTDGGGSFSTVDAGTVTSSNLESVQFENSQLGWFGGASGALVRYYQGALSLITTGLAVTINDVAVPPSRSDEVYLATAGGEIYRSDDALLTTPTFTSKSFDRSGNGQVLRLYFYGSRGQFLFFIQADGDSDGRIMRDNSGGALGVNVERVGEFDKPENNGINALAIATENEGMAVGEVISSYAFIGKMTY